MGKKYIIEIPEDKITDFVGSTHFLMPYMMAGHIGHHDTGLPIEPYTEPDLGALAKENFERGYRQRKAEDEKEIQEVYQRGLSDAWEAARKIANMPYNEEEKAFGSGGWAFIEKHTASEAIEKIRQYEQEKEEKEEQIQVGDEVNAPFGKAIVVNVDSVAEKIWVLYADGHGGFDFFKNAPTKTGRHFPEIAEALRKMRE